jgi:hypothetical protein
MAAAAHTSDKNRPENIKTFINTLLTVPFRISPEILREVMPRIYDVYENPFPLPLDDETVSRETMALKEKYRDTVHPTYGRAIVMIDQAMMHSNVGVSKVSVPGADVMSATRAIAGAPFGARGAMAEGVRTARAMGAVREGLDELEEDLEDTGAMLGVTSDLLKKIQESSGSSSSSSKRGRKSRRRSKKKAKKSRSKGKSKKNRTRSRLNGKRTRSKRKTRSSRK